MEKAELITRVDEHHDVFGPALMEFAEAADNAKAIADIVQAPECRLAVALANVEEDKDEAPTGERREH